MDDLKIPTDGLIVQGIGKAYKNKKVLHNVDLKLQKGEVVALLGPNGAGKTTTINILTGLVFKDSGNCLVFGKDTVIDYRETRSKIGIAAQELSLDWFFSIEKLLYFQAGYYGIPKEKAKEQVDDLLYRLGLEEKRNSRLRQLSGGMKRRFQIAKALVHDPKILILDEPTAGVDIELRREMWDFLKEINANGTTIILTTHYLEEAEQLCKNIAIIDHGEIVEDTNMKDLLSRLDVQGFVLDLDKPISAAPQIEGFPMRLDDPTTLVAAVSKDNNINDLFKLLSAQSIQVNSMRNESNRLEELFIEMVKR